MKRWYKSESIATADAKRENCDIVCTRNGWTDIYYLIPRSAGPGIYRTIARSQDDCNGKMPYRVLYKDNLGGCHCLDEVSEYRIRIVKRGLIPENLVLPYLRGYYTRREESSRKIRILKEAARISHDLCDDSGKRGHEKRQELRKSIRKELESKILDS